MKVSKRVLILISLLCSVFIVYGAALVVKLTKGNFLLENGLNGFGYILLTLDIAMPVIVYILITDGIYKKNIFEVVSFAGLFILLIYVPVYFSSVSVNSTISLFESKTFVFIILVMSVIFVISSHLVVNSTRSPKKW